MARVRRDLVIFFSVMAIACFLAAVFLISSRHGLDNSIENKSFEWTSPPGKTLVWSDEFEGTTINNSNWDYDVGPWEIGNELECYTDNRSNAYLSNDSLVISAIKRDMGESSYTSARLKTEGKRAWKYGTIVAKMKLPYGKGIWPAFWMMGNNFKSVGWPNCGEIDAMEMIGGGNGDRTVYGSMYWGNDPQKFLKSTRSKVLPSPLSEDWHYYQVDWDPSSVVMKVDGEEYFREDISNLPYFHQPFFIILNTAVGGNWPGSPDETTTFPQNMYIDWVRVYQERPNIKLGLSKIELNSSDTVGVQVDRVIRDIAWNNSSFDIKVPANRIPHNSSEVVPYMEGARVQEMMNWAGGKVLPLTPGRAKKLGNDSDMNKYYASDGKGNFRFQIDESKTEYKSVYKPKSRDNETADLIMPDTHGFNAIAEQAYLHRKDIYLAVACMDLPSKAQAALYLAQNGINIYAPCDRFASDLMNYKEKFGIQKTILGSAPVKKTERGAIIGDQPVTIYLDEPIAVEYTDREYPDQYCDAPWRYFNKLNEIYGLNLSLITVYANAGEAGKVIEKAERAGAQVVGVRVYNDSDYEPVARWLKKDPNHRAVLLHSVAYDDGSRLFQEFPKQTTFGDLNPVIQWDNYADQALPYHDENFVRITKPQNGSDVSWRYVVKGVSSVANNSGLYVYVLVKSPDEGRWWLNDASEIFSNGSWEMNVPGAFIGEDPRKSPADVNAKYRIVAIVTKKKLDGEGPFDNLPANVMKSDEIEVKRSGYPFE
jgi:beta-glucanase (GH16 family)